MAEGSSVYLGVDSDGEEHDEEEDGPERGEWEVGDGLGVDDEGRVRARKR